MPEYIWRVSLKPHLTEEQLRESPYSIAKKLGMSKNTVLRYMESDEELTSLVSANVGVLARYFGVDEMKVISLVEAPTEDDSSGQQKTLLATA